jgi:hypothetical protein
MPDGCRRAPCKASTIVMRKRELVAAANMAIRSGLDIERLNSLAAMLQPAFRERKASVACCQTDV